MPSELHAIFRSLLTLDAASLPEPIPELAPSVEALRGEYARRTGQEPGLGDVEEAPEDDKEDKEGEGNVEFDPDTLYVAIGAADSTVVYYKLSRGIRKPHDIPDE